MQDIKFWNRESFKNVVYPNQNDPFPQRAKSAPKKAEMGRIGKIMD